LALGTGLEGFERYRLITTVEPSPPRLTSIP
jgi:hypothetical protein